MNRPEISFLNDYLDNKKQQGFSLVELMVSMMIGLFLIFTVVSSYSSNKSSSTFRAELGELEANARIAMTFLRDGIEHAGYPSIYIHAIDKAFLTESDGNVSGFVCDTDGAVSYQEATYINRYNRYTKDQRRRDRISIAFMPDNPRDPEALYWQDCAGSYAADPATNSIQAANCSADPVSGQGRLAVVYNSYFIGDNKLKCTSSRNITVPIADGIEAMQFRYGVKAGGNTVYQRASVVEDNNSWGNVVSVQMALLVRSKNEVLPVETEQGFMLLDRRIYKTDRYLRKVFTSTVHLSNVDRAN